ncbi:galactose-3-O-sulfotransferase 3-like [Branchiostoma lanceolatum]|uniref:galactose-3-O-sulfotransferase 3-like n=1 Tax=Branchiostoma lanceolatum TaxID=7740 RepID=UPI0034571127
MLLILYRSSEGKVTVTTGHRPALRSGESPSGTTNQTSCDRPVTNFVFIKVHKTGSGSTFLVLARFGRNHGLTICYPIHDQHRRLSYHSPNLNKSVCEPAVWKYTLIINHAIMNKTAMDSIMAPGTRYIGIVRHPLDHFRSMFFYGNQPTRDKVNPIGKYLDSKAHYNPGRGGMGRLGKQVSHQKNFQAYTLGFPRKLFGSRKKSELDETLRTVGSWYSIVLITEYWEESLVLLRRTFCWTTYDILHTTKRIHSLNNPKKSFPLTDTQKETHRKISPIDYLIYEHFNRTFWERAAMEGPDFWDEVAYFKTVNLEVNQHCNISKGERVFPRSKWSPEFAVDSTFCDELNWTTTKWNSELLLQLQRINEEMRRKQAQIDTG